MGQIHFGGEVVNSIPLARAILCEDCTHFSDSTTNRCGHCGSTAVMNLAKVLDREAVREEVGNWKPFISHVSH